MEPPHIRDEAPRDWNGIPYSDVIDFAVCVASLCSFPFLPLDGRGQRQPRDTAVVTPTVSDSSPVLYSVNGMHDDDDPPTPPHPFLCD